MPGGKIASELVRKKDERDFNSGKGRGGQSGIKLSDVWRLDDRESKHTIDDGVEMDGIQWWVLVSF